MGIQDERYGNSSVLEIDDSGYSSYGSIDFMDYLTYAGYKPIEKKVNEGEYGYVFHKPGQFLYEVWTTNIIKVISGTFVVGYINVPDADEKVAEFISTLRELSDWGKEGFDSDFCPTHEVEFTLKILI